MDGDGNLVTAWLGLPENHIYFKTSDNLGKSWTQPKAIPGILGSWDIYQSILDTFSMATDSNGNIHMVLVGHINNNQSALSVIELVWNGRNWSEPEIVATLEGFVPEWPRIAINNGNQIHLTWFVRRNSDIWTNPATNRLWYAHGQILSPAKTPINWPTLTPPPISTINNIESESYPVSTDMPIVPPNPDLRSVENEILAYSEKEYLIIAVISLIPVVLLVGVVSAGVLYWRKNR
jgi:hypothetical protein